MVYFNPYHDVLWFSMSIADKPVHLRALERHYGGQLDAITTILVEEMEWFNKTLTEYTL